MQIIKTTQLEEDVYKRQPNRFPTNRGSKIWRIKLQIR